ncbi:hypothetical protein Pmani_029709 [Petrolisthes manimaculis]|uniref:Secreted protein n=1 Tax=Petrolisthes manimaculis TaxID=1843537 RepID=A0AAE1TU68_9EUCA|nr:hypothetical protein Pmani_029709 [Petrolisthes manimaculis]
MLLRAAHLAVFTWLVVTSATRETRSPQVAKKQNIKMAVLVFVVVTRAGLWVNTPPTTPTPQCQQIEDAPNLNPLSVYIAN